MTIDQPNETKTMTSFAESSQQLTRSTAKPDPAKSQMIAAMIVKLASHYHRPDFGPEQAKHMALDFIEDLSDYTIGEIDNSIKAYRRDAKSKFFPTPGHLIAIIVAARKERADMDKISTKPLPNDPRPHLWWMQSRTLWKPHWLECEVPAGEFVRDAPGETLRPARRIV